VFWIDISSQSSAKADIIGVGKMLEMEVSTVEDGLILLSNINKPCLLILDNADDPNFDYHMYLPADIKGGVIMTSRVTQNKHHSTVGFEELTSLDKEDCRELLFKAAKIPKGRWQEHAEEADNVVRLLESHTLAVIQAGAYITNHHCNLADYPMIFNQQRNILMKYRPSQARSRYSDVYTTFEASAKVLSDDALQLLGILSVLHFGFVSIDIFASAWLGSQQALQVESKNEMEIGDISGWDVGLLIDSTDLCNKETGLDVFNEWHAHQLPTFIDVEAKEWNPFRLNESIIQLESLSLIKRVDQDGTSGLSMHPLAHTWAKDRQNAETMRQSWIAGGCMIALSVLEHITRERLGRQLTPHVQSFIDQKTKSKLTCGSQRNLLALLWSFSWMLVWIRDDSRLERTVREIFQELDLDPERPQHLSIPLYHLLAETHFYNGHMDMASDIISKVIEIRKRTLQNEGNLLSAMYIYGWALLENGQVEAAILQSKRLVEVARTTMSETHPFRLDIEHTMATMYRNNGHIKEAVELLESVVNIREKTLAETYPDRLSSQRELAGAYLISGHTSEAIELLESVVKIRKKTLAETHPGRLTSQHELAGAYLISGHTSEAIELLESVVKIRKKTLAETHPHRLASQHELARAYLKFGRTSEAVELLEGVVKIEGGTLQETHPNRLASQHELAGAYLKSGRSSEAVELLESVVKIKERTLQETHTERLISQQVLAYAYLQDGRVKEAVKLFRHIVPRYETVFEVSHRHRQVAESHLATALKELGSENA
jgi:tetratricopeptide (TPR) repeat protein